MEALHKQFMASHMSKSEKLVNQIAEEFLQG
jgi:hypothetical protein